MSWIDKIQNPLVITTGDGRQWQPKWMDANEAISYNIAEFEFPSVEGTLVRRGKKKGGRYELVLFFDGEDHLDISDSFEISARDERPWAILHPYFGSFFAQPLGLNIDRTMHNVTKITATVVETISDENPITSVRPGDQALVNIDEVYNTAPEVFTEGFTVQNAARQKTLLNSIYRKGNPFSIPEYFNVYTVAQTSLDNAISDAEGTIRAINTFLNAPAIFVSSTQNRIRILADQFQSLRATIGVMLNVSDKQLYQNTGSAIITSMAHSAITPQNRDYRNRADIVLVIETLIDNYNLLLTDLDALQDINGGNPLYFIPDQSLMWALNQLINNVIASLFATSLGARQQRQLILEADTNIVNLTHRLYGLDPFDNNITELMDNNGWGLNQLFSIRKNTTVSYFI